MEFAQAVDVERNLLIKHPAPILVAGSTGSGKTRLIRSLLYDFDKISTLNRQVKVIWAYGIYQELYRTPIDGAVKTIRYVQGFPESADDCDILVLDDLQSTAGNDTRLADLFSRFSHHRNISVIFVVQNIFLQSKAMRNVTLNTHYLFLLSSRRDRNQIAKLASQLYPGQTKYFLEAYKSALSTDWSYLLVDLTPTTREEFRLRSNIIPTSYPMIVYQKSDG